MKVSSDIIASGLAESERMIEEEIGDEAGMYASLLRIVVDNIAGAIKAEHPRFHAGEFQIQSMPISSERMKQAILATFAYGEDEG